MCHDAFHFISVTGRRTCHLPGYRRLLDNYNTCVISCAFHIQESLTRALSHVLTHHNYNNLTNDFSYDAAVLSVREPLPKPIKPLF